MLEDEDLDVGFVDFPDKQAVSCTSQSLQWLDGYRWID
jgi:hypothetical protein